MNRRLKIAFIALLAITVVSVSYAAILVQRQLATTFRIKRSAAMDIFDVDAQTPLTSINFGDFLWGEWYLFPGKTTTHPPAQRYYVNNTDQTDFYVKISWTQVEQISVSVYMRRLDQPTFTELYQQGQIYQFPLTSPTLDPGNPLRHAAEFYIFIACNPGAPFGDKAMDITFTAVDTPTG